MVETTPRGFRIDRFIDAYGVPCSLQESSVWADEGHVWFGCDEVGLEQLGPPPGTWHSVKTRMHLSQSQVRSLLPALQHFAEHGLLPTTEGHTTPKKKSQIGTHWRKLKAAFRAP